jgi:hypothetical protein
MLSGLLRRELVSAVFSGAGSAGGLAMLKARGFRFRRGDVFVWEVPLVNVVEGDPHPGPIPDMDFE